MQRESIARSARALLGIGLIVACVGSIQSSSTAIAAPPNFVVVFIDDMGWGDLSCFGNREATTPHLDRLAAEGLRFEQFYVNAPICSPSRTALSTGQYPQRWRITSYLDNRATNEARGVAQWLDPAAPMLARRLQQQGYATGHFGKWHMGGQRDVGDAPLISAYGFDASLTNFEGLGPRVLPLCDAFDGAPPRKHALGSDQLGHGPIIWEDRSRITQSFTRAATQFIQDAAARQQPFYVNVWPDDVHSPFFPPQALRGAGNKRDLYLGVLQAMDQQLAPLWELIRENRSLRENTLVLVCSDNGPEFGAGSAGPFRGHKAMLYEGGIRSPLIVWGPGFIAPAQVSAVNRESILAAIDVAPTLLALTQEAVGNRATGNTPEVQLDGEALPEVLLGKSQQSREQPLYFRRPPDRDAIFGFRELPDLAMRAGPWKLLCEYDGSAIELYDLRTDPGETTNVAEQHPEQTENMKTALLAWHRMMPPDRGAEYRPRSQKKAGPARRS